jgi:hypothetical protein
LDAYFALSCFGLSSAGFVSIFLVSSSLFFSFLIAAVAGAIGIVGVVLLSLEDY